MGMGDRWEGARLSLLVVLGVGALVALSAVMASSAFAAPSVGEPKKLTAEQRESFSVGAKKIAGLSKAEIARALRNPEDLGAIPVSVEDSFERGATPAAGEEGSAALASPAYCTYLKGTRSYVNVYKQKLFSVTGTKNWCFDYSAVTSAPPAKLNYAVTAQGSKEGWKFVRLVQRDEGYRAYAGYPRGSHVSLLTARFRSCSTGARCTNVYPQYTGIGRYDGTGFQTIRTLSAAPTS